MMKIFLATIMMIFVTTGCMIGGSDDETSTSDPSTGSTPTPTTSTPTSCYSAGVGSRATDYFKFSSPIITSRANGSTPVWSTSQYLTPTVNSNIMDHFTTDGVLKFRVVALPSPGATPDVCNYGEAYNKLKVTIRVRAFANANDFYDFTTPTLNLNECTSAIEVPTSSIPVNSFSPYEPLILEVMDIHSDLACIWSGGDGYGCPISRHIQPDCVAFDIQMVTSNTKDFY